MKKDGILLWEAHRGGGGGFEMPESCMASFEYGWLLGGRPEADINETKDGCIVSVHDATLDRIVPELPAGLRGKKISELSKADFSGLSTGGTEYPGQKIPFLEDLFRVLKQDPSRNMVLDYKNVDLKKLAAMIDSHGVAGQLTFASCDMAKCAAVKAMLPAIRTKLWIGGPASAIENTFRKAEQEKMKDLDEVQLHLNDAQNASSGTWRYDLAPEAVSRALAAAEKRGVVLQTLPWKFEKQDLFRILDLGVRSFAVDYPIRFIKACAEYFARAE